MKNAVRHEGVVETIEDRHVRVRFVQYSACGSCQIAGHCPASEAKEKVVDVYEADTTGLRIGDQVTVTTQMSMVTKALLLGFGLPLLLMLAALAVTKTAGGSDGLSALLMLAVLVPYYICIWLMRSRISHSISFQIEK